MKYKTIRIYDYTFDKLDRLCVKYKSSKTELTAIMCEYFTKTGIDPNDPSDVTSSVKKLKNQLVSFIRTQEKEKLNPLIKKQDLLIERFMTHIEEETVTKEFMMELAQAIVDKLKK